MINRHQWLSFAIYEIIVSILDSQRSPTPNNMSPSLQQQEQVLSSKVLTAQEELPIEPCRGKQNTK